MSTSEMELYNAVTAVRRAIWNGEDLEAAARAAADKHGQDAAAVAALANQAQAACRHARRTGATRHPSNERTAK